MSFTLAKKQPIERPLANFVKGAISYANTFGNSSGQKSSRQLGLSGKRSRLLARTTFQTTDGKDYSYEQFEHAYRTAYSSFLKNPVRNSARSKVPLPSNTSWENPIQRCRGIPCVRQ